MKSSLLSVALLLLSSSSSFAFLPRTTITSRMAISSSSLQESNAADVVANGLLGGAHISALTKEVPKVIFTSEQIDQILPHRYPFALVDKVVEYEAGKRAVGVKSVTKNEPHFNGHFPNRPIMPGVLQVEALAQLAGIVCLQMEGASPGAVFFFAGVDGVKWKRPVVPGDTLVMEVEITKWNSRFGIAKATGKAYVDGALVVEVTEMTFALAKWKNVRK